MDVSDPLFVKRVKDLFDVLTKTFPYAVFNLRNPEAEYIQVDLYQAYRGVGSNHIHYVRVRVSTTTFLVSHGKETEAISALHPLLGCRVRSLRPPKPVLGGELEHQKVETLYGVQAALNLILNQTVPSTHLPTWQGMSLDLLPGLVMDNWILGDLDPKSSHYLIGDPHHHILRPGDFAKPIVFRNLAADNYTLYDPV